MSEKLKVGMTAEQAWEFQNGRIAGLIQQLIEKDARIAELEAREVSIPAACADDEYFIDGVFQPLRYERDVERALQAAGISIKGE
ncbi:MULTISPECIES: hypothetical protein [unclassified Leclercia]|uniref:Ead/Ea22-like family protein n=1 Tax=Leclercia barmai TaxID=2785629 RepID=A0ABS7RS35_9ENTR|nr:MULTISPECIES: hypothetical protein [unclassified Leclercia]MBZ0057134.1 hypothetical protein [Leclercia sp. EMC7]MCM5695309.1 hypothetical protein [Leclercia sp. LTM01]MCM5699716.1 hypothetical protein [Leclercia sp. LTM14]